MHAQCKILTVCVLLFLLLYQISAEELRQCLSQSGMSAYPRPGDSFSLETCRVMIGMLDTDHSGTMGLNEFRELWRAIEGWKVSARTFVPMCLCVPVCLCAGICVCVCMFLMLSLHSCLLCPCT